MTNPIIPNGKSPDENSFVTKMAQQILSTQSEVQGTPQPTEEFSFDGFKIAGYQNVVGEDKRFIRPEDKGRAFQIVLGS